MNDQWTGKHGHVYINDYLKPGRHAWSDEYHDKVSRARDYYEVCIVCGKRTTRDRGIPVVLGLGGCYLIHPDDVEEAQRHDSGYLGAHMVGPECGRNIPHEFRMPHPRPQ